MFWPLLFGQDESSLLAGTSEGTVVQFQFLSPTLGASEKEWVRTRTFKHHTHDVRAVAEIGTAVVSGGQSASLEVSVDEWSVGLLVNLPAVHV